MGSERIFEKKVNSDIKYTPNVRVLNVWGVFFQGLILMKLMSLLVFIYHYQPQMMNFLYCAFDVVKLCDYKAVCLIRVCYYNSVKVW